MGSSPLQPVRGRSRDRAARRLALRDHDQGDEARSRPQRRHAADLRGRADARRTRRSTARTSTGRSRSSATASTRSASPSRRSRRSAPIRSRSACPAVQTRRARDRPGRRDGPALLLRPRAERHPARSRPRASARSPRPTSTQQSTTSLYDAVELASKQPEDLKPARRSASARARACYLFEKQSRLPVAGPEEKRRPTCSRPTPPRRSPRTTRRSSRSSREPSSPRTRSRRRRTARFCRRRYFVLQDRPALSGEDLTNPEQTFDQTQPPIVTFDFTDEGRQAFQTITQADRPARPRRT